MSEYKDLWPQVYWPDNGEGSDGGSGGAISPGEDGRSSKINKGCVLEAAVRTIQQLSEENKTVRGHLQMLRRRIRGMKKIIQDCETL